MVNSMTGYGRGQGNVVGIEVSVEIRSVNHRYFDLNIRSPRRYTFLEDPIKTEVSRMITRGKVDVFLTIEHQTGDDICISLNRKVLEGYLSAIAQMENDYGLKNDLTVSGAARLPDLFKMEKEEENAERLTAGVMDLLQAAMAEYSEMRGREGAHLKEDILSRLVTIEQYVDLVEKRSPETVEQYRQRLAQKMTEVLESTNIDESRILQEAAIYSDKIAVDEETVRLRSHIAQLRSMLDSGGPIGRKMDFLMQEFNRESNTIGSKCNDADIARVVIDLKSEIEKMREQVQNIE